MEVDVQSKIQALLRFFKAWVFKAIASSRNGTPDVIACIPITQDEANSLFKQRETIGLFVAIEVKDSTKKAEGRKLQEIQLKRIRKAGGLALVINDVSQLKDVLYELKKKA